MHLRGYETGGVAGRMVAAGVGMVRVVRVRAVPPDVVRPRRHRIFDTDRRRREPTTSDRSSRNTPVGPARDFGCWAGGSIVTTGVHGPRQLAGRMPRLVTA